MLPLAFSDLEVELVVDADAEEIFGQAGIDTEGESGWAAAITGITLITDGGYMSSGITGSFPPATAAANFLLGRY